MKAWLVRVKDEQCAEVVFAETSGRARALAMNCDCCEDAPFVDIEVCRMPQADKYYEEGRWHLDWEDPADRIVLVKECGFVCTWDWFDLKDCAVCSAREYCDLYKDRIQEMED